MTTYEALVARDGKWWMVSLPAIDGLTQARRLSEATTMAREYIAASQDIPLEEVVVNLCFAAIGGLTDITERVAMIAEERDQADALEKSALQHAAGLARTLAEADVPLRDIGTMLGISHQRAHQLISSQ